MSTKYKYIGHNPDMTGHYFCLESNKNVVILMSDPEENPNEHGMYWTGQFPVFLNLFQEVEE